MKQRRAVSILACVVFLVLSAEHSSAVLVDRGNLVGCADYDGNLPSANDYESQWRQSQDYTKLTTAIDYTKSSLDAAQRCFGPHDKRTGNAMALLGVRLALAEQHGEAQVILEHAIQIISAAEGSASANLVEPQITLAKIYEQQDAWPGHLAVTEVLLKSSAEIAQKLKPADNQKLTDSLQALTDFYKKPETAYQKPEDDKRSMAAAMAQVASEILDNVKKDQEERARLRLKLSEDRAAARATMVEAIKSMEAMRQSGQLSKEKLDQLDQMEKTMEAMDRLDQAIGTMENPSSSNSPSSSHATH
jgi:hypothetical protein